MACVAAGVGAFRVRPRRPDLLWPASVLAGGVIAQGLLGGLTVALDLTWPVVIAHYLLSMVLLLAGAVLVWRVRGAAGEGVSDRWLTLLVRALVVYGGVVIVAGTFATAAGPHAGGAGTGDVVERLDAFGVNTLDNLIQIHGHMAAVMGFVALVVWGLAYWRGSRGTLLRALSAVCLLLGAQGIVGLDPVLQRAAGRGRVDPRLAARRSCGSRWCGAGSPPHRRRTPQPQAPAPSHEPALVR